MPRVKAIFFLTHRYPSDHPGLSISPGPLSTKYGGIHLLLIIIRVFPKGTFSVSCVPKKLVCIVSYGTARIS